jgi:hypothetical protein
VSIFYHRRESENLLIYSEEFKIVILSFKKFDLAYCLLRGAFKIIDYPELRRRY